MPKREQLGEKLQDGASWLEMNFWYNRINPVAASFNSEVSCGLKRTTSCDLAVVIGFILRMNARSVASLANVGDTKIKTDKQNTQKWTNEQETG